MVPLKKKVLKYGTPKPRYSAGSDLGMNFLGPGTLGSLFRGSGFSSLYG